MTSEPKKIINFTATFALCVLLLLTSLYMSRFQHFFAQSDTFIAPGYMDSVEYWSAYRAWSAGANPYDPATLHALQSSITSKAVADPVMMWNPPSLLGVFSPLLRIDSYYFFARIWNVAALLAYLFGILLLAKSFAPTFLKDPKFWVLSLTFIPFLNCLYFGQLSCFLFFGAACFFSGFKTKSITLQVLGMLLLSFKPHLLLPFWLGLLILFIRKKDWRTPVTAFFAVMFSLVVGIHGYDWRMLLDWYQKVSGTIPVLNAVSTSQWVGTTLSTPLRNIVDYLWPPGALAAAELSPLIGLLFVPYVLRTFDSLTALAVLVVISIPTARYGWIYDYAILLVPMTILLAQATDRALSFRLLFITSFIAFFPIQTIFTRQDEALYSLLPLTLVLLWLFNNNAKAAPLTSTDIR